MSALAARVRRRTAAVLAATLVLALTVSCARSAWEMPDGIVTSPADRGKLVVGGIYPSTLPNDTSCCWVQRRSHFLVEKYEPATDLALELFLPDIAFVRAHPQRMDVTLDGSYRFHKCCIGPGGHTVLITLPRPLQDSAQPIDVALSFSESFVPAKLHWTSDERSLAAILLGATLRQL